MWRTVLRARSLLPNAVPARVPVPPRARPGTALLCSRVNQGGAVQATGPSTQPAAPEPACSAYKLQGRIPSALDRKLLLWSGRFKREQDIPEMVSNEMLYAAGNKIRVKICYMMIGLTVVACLIMVVSGRKAFKQHENLTKWNLEKKAKLKEEFEQKMATEKPQ
ncbi:protein FAM162A-like [Hemiscyllium ocellatum]|uniref:protein FAM162A-like n=1 Tax=Hemiscyllium ocellatum TaxID=170820 RepID=UPI00296638A1|nr:protein FAM162A-like [Hemiscyllium ocellatum]